MSDINDSENKIELIKSQARRNNRTPREHCIMKINQWKMRLQYFSEDYRELDRELFEKRLEQERDDID